MKHYTVQRQVFSTHASRKNSLWKPERGRNARNVETVSAIAKVVKKPSGFFFNGKQYETVKEATRAAAARGYTEYRLGGLKFKISI